MTDSFVRSLTLDIISRVLPDGGFSSIPGGQYRPDATAWAVLGLLAVGERLELVSAARVRLAEDQRDDGRVSLSEDHPAEFWPTAMAVLAWNGSDKYHPMQMRGIHFLLNTTGLHPKQEKNSPWCASECLQLLRAS